MAVASSAMAEIQVSEILPIPQVRSAFDRRRLVRGSERRWVRADFAPLSNAYAKGVALSESCGGSDAREKSMNLQRREFLVVATLVTAAAAPALAQTPAPSV